MSGVLEFSTLAPQSDDTQWDLLAKLVLLFGGVPASQDTARALIARLVELATESSGSSLSPEISDDFSEANDTSIQGKAADTGQIWSGATTETPALEVATVQDGALRGFGTTWYSKISIETGTIRNVGARIKATDREAGAATVNDQAFLFLLGPELDTVGDHAGKTFIHAAFRPAVLGTDTQKVTIDITENGVPGLINLFDEQTTGAGAGVSGVFELQLDGDTLTVIYPGGRTVLTDSRFLLCHGRHVWIEAFNFEDDPRFIIDVEEFWANAPDPQIGVDVQPYSQNLATLASGLLKLKQVGPGGTMSIQFQGMHTGTGIRAEDVGGNDCVSIYSMGIRTLLCLQANAFFNGDIFGANLGLTGHITAVLPTVNPAVAGRFWNDGGTVKISAG